jgi:hypothetical protein
MSFYLMFLLAHIPVVLGLWTFSIACRVRESFWHDEQHQLALVAKAVFTQFGVPRGR